MNRHQLTLVLSVSCFLVLISTLSGCNSKRPTGFPELVSYTLQVGKNGQPVQDASVNLVPEKTGQEWTVGGATNDKGLVVFYTHMNAYMEKGVPEGKYKVTISKIPDVPERLSKQEMDKLSKEEFVEYTARLQKAMDAAPKEVPSILSSRSNTPLSITVTQTDNSLTVKLEDYL